MFTFAGKKPEKYDFPDVPLLDGNFVNETHIKYGDTIIAAGKEYEKSQYFTKIVHNIKGQNNIICYKQIQ